MRTRARLLTAGAALTILILGEGAHAQGPTLPFEGARVRIQAGPPHPGSFTGTLVGMSADSLTLRRANHRLTLPAASLLRLDTSQGSSGNAARGALVGTLVGAGLGAAIGLSSDDGSGSGSYGTPSSPVLGLVLGGMLGLAAGTGVGALVRSERWVAIPAQSLVPIESPRANCGGTTGPRRALVPGDRIRILSPSLGNLPQTGTLQASSDSAIVYTHRGSTIRLSPCTITALEVNTKSHGHGAVGALVGIGAAFIAGRILADDDDESGPGAAETGSYLAILGLPMGFAIGSSIHSSSWTRATIPAGGADAAAATTVDGNRGAL